MDLNLNKKAIDIIKDSHLLSIVLQFNSETNQTYLQQVSRWWYDYIIPITYRYINVSVKR